MDKPPKEWRITPLPDGSRVIVVARYADESRLSLYDSNHNIIRIDTDGNLLWQVSREERGRYDWQCQYRAAITAGIDGPRNSFDAIEEGLWLSRDQPYGGEALVPGLKLIAFGYVNSMPYNVPYGMYYELDIDTGLAVNVTPFSSKRSW